MKKIAMAVLAGALGLCTSAFADASLVSEKQCMQCHKVKEDFAGPSFQKIAARWKGKGNAVEMLATTVRKGSVGEGLQHWGKARMPDDSERPLVSEEEARKMVRWILTQ
jgi:cytochrome c